MDNLRQWPGRPHQYAALAVLVGVPLTVHLSDDGWAGQVGGTLSVQVRVVDTCTATLSDDGELSNLCNGDSEANDHATMISSQQSGQNSTTTFMTDVDHLQGVVTITY